MRRCQAVGLDDRKMNPDDKAKSDAGEPEGMTQKIRKCFSPMLGSKPVIAARDVEIFVRKEPQGKTCANKKQRQYKTKHCHKQ